MQGIRLPKYKKISTIKAVNTYNKPKVVYIPLISQADTDITALVKKGDYVYKGTIVGKSKGNLRIPIHASISGNVLDFEEKTYLNGLKVKCVVIENDFKEKIEKRNNIKKEIDGYTKEEFIETIKEAGIVGLGGGGFPTYVKYSSNEKITTLIINAVECEPYITADYMLLTTKCEEVLEAIDAIIDINNIDEAIIAIKKGNVALKDHINNFIGTYLKIKLVEVPNFYPMGWERNLVKFVTGETYVKLPMEKGVVVNNASTIYAIYEALKFDRPLTERIITFTGEMLKEPQNVLVKLGTPISEIIEFLGGYTDLSNIKFVAGGPMMGVSLPNDELVATSNLNCVLVLKQGLNDPTSECLRCGKCIAACPAKLSPVLIKDNIKNINRLRELEPLRCIECGLCSYICPAKITVREFVKTAKLEVLKEGIR